MSSDFETLIDEAILLELNVARLYLLFHEKLKEDSTFWWQLTLEEENHAALLKTVKQMAKSDIDIPLDLFPEGIADLKASNSEIEKAYEDFSAHVDRSQAFRYALKIESSAGELHYNSFMKEDDNSRIGQVFRKLNGDDIDHAERIRKYAEDNNIL